MDLMGILNKVKQVKEKFDDVVNDKLSVAGDKLGNLEERVSEINFLNETGVQTDAVLAELGEVQTEQVVEPVEEPQVDINLDDFDDLL